MPGEPVFLAVGKLRRPHGVRGEMLMEVLTDFPDRLQVGVEVYAGPEHRPLRLRGVRPHREGLLVSFDEYFTPESAGELRNQLLYIGEANLPPLPAGEFYHHQVVGLRVVDQAGRLLGSVTGILETGANDVLVVRSETGPEMLIPYADPFIVEVSLEKGEMHVHTIPGMLPGEQED